MWHEDCNPVYLWDMLQADWLAAALHSSATHTFPTNPNVLISTTNDRDTMRISRQHIATILNR